MKHIQMSLPQICSSQFSRDCYFTMETKPALTQKTVLTTRNDQTLDANIQEEKQGRINITHTLGWTAGTMSAVSQKRPCSPASLDRSRTQLEYNHPQGPTHQEVCDEEWNHRQRRKDRGTKRKMNDLSVDLKRARIYKMQRASLPKGEAIKIKGSELVPPSGGSSQVTFDDH